MRPFQGFERGDVSKSRENYKLYSYKNKIIYYIFKFSLFIENEIKEKLKDLAFKIKRFLK